MNIRNETLAPLIEEAQQTGTIPPALVRLVTCLIGEAWARLKRPHGKVPNRASWEDARQTCWLRTLVILDRIDTAKNPYSLLFETYTNEIRMMGRYVRNRERALKRYANSLLNG